MTIFLSLSTTCACCRDSETDVDPGSKQCVLHHQGMVYNDDASKDEENKQYARAVLPQPGSA